MHYNQFGNDFGQQGHPRRHRQNYFEPPPFGPPPAVGVSIGPPPGFTPPIPAWQVGSNGFRYCLHNNTYVWLSNGNSFWFFPTFVGRHSIVGLRWSRRRGWVNHIINRNEVRTFQCF
jgi:hypothetical protein